MHTFPKRIKILGEILLICILLAGCGDTPQPALDKQEQEENTAVSYKLTEQLLPDPQEALPEGIYEDGTWELREEKSYFLSDSWYLLSQFYIKGSGAVSACIQVLAPPYDHWESYEISYRQLLENTGGWVETVAGIEEEGALLELAVRDQKEHLLGYYGWNGTWEPLLEIPESLNGAFWHRTEEGLQAASGGSRTLTVFDRACQEQYSQSLSGKVEGILRNPIDHTFSWYGFEVDELVLWDGESGRVSRRITDQINQYGDFRMAYSHAGELLLADAEQVWLCGKEDKELQELFSFLELGYPLDTIYGCDFREDGAMQFFVSCDGEKILLTAEVCDSVEVSEKQEITIALNVGGYTMKKLVARYNRQSENYHVTIIAPKEGEELEDYHRWIQLEMASGRGPDLLGQYILNEREAAAQGYLEPLDWVIEDMSPFMESAFLAGRIDGVTYGIPYRFRPYFLAVSKQITEKTSWTLDEMMEEVRNSSAEVLEYGRSGVGIVMYYGLYDEENKELIDWETGESHLTEEPFLKLLAFAKEYADTGKYSEEEFMNRLMDGTIAGVDPYIDGPGALNKIGSCFGDEGVLIGYPRESGNGIYMTATMLYMNQNSVNKEGAADFLRYLLSEEGQKKYMQYEYWYSFSVRRSVNEYGLERYQQGVMDPPTQYRTSSGFYWEETTLDEEQIRQYWWLLDAAVPVGGRAEELWTMVEEELQPYFNGDRSAEEVAAVLDSRVQLYLNERK